MFGILLIVCWPGKWHLGYFSPLFLPTARGFDTFMGYLNGENYYWSKRSPDYPEHVDLMAADAACFAAYTQPDIHNYSTLLYTNHAVELLTQQAADKPFLLYIAYQVETIPPLAPPLAPPLTCTCTWQQHNFTALSCDHFPSSFSLLISHYSPFCCAPDP